MPARWLGVVPLVALPVLTIIFFSHWSPWVYMWTLALSVYVGCKWLSWWDADPMRSDAPAWRHIAYLLVYPCMDASRFLSRSRPTDRPLVSSWAWACVKALTGVALFWGVARTVPPDWPIATGWVGMAGAILMLHFGLFELSTLGWRMAGVNATTLMRNPLGATTLSDFWGRRWNRAFNELAHDHVFRPLARRVGPGPATMLTFFASGLLHDLVTSVPAGGGDGLPTLYFCLQGIGVLIQRGRIGRRTGVQHGASGRIFTAALLLGPLYWLFHPHFVLNVFVPFMRAFGAL